MLKSPPGATIQENSNIHWNEFLELNYFSNSKFEKQNHIDKAEIFNKINNNNKFIKSVLQP